MKDVPHSYLMDIIKKSESIDEAEENLILAEELHEFSKSLFP